MRINIRFWRTPKLDATPLDACELSTRAQNSLKRNGFFTFKDILDRIKAREDLSQYKGLGVETASEIIQKMADYMISQFTDEEYERYIKEMWEINYGERFIANQAV